MSRVRSLQVPRKDRSGPFTYEDYRSIVPDGQKADLIDGVIYMASPDNTDAGELSVWLIALLHDFCECHNLGKVYASRIAFKLDEKNSPEPDIGVVLIRHLDRVDRGHVLGPADLAIEIVSPESVQRDYEKKRRLYEKYAFPEYWIVDEELEKVTLLRLGPRGYREARPRKGCLLSTVLPGFWFRPAWVWQQPRPKKSAVLAEILAGPPK
jgi:Uma2 family endonuclease